MRPVAAVLISVMATGLLSRLPAQTPDPAAGHWEGTLQIPNRELNVVVDLRKNEKQAWVGHFSFAGGGPQEVPLEDIRVTADTVHFRLGGGLPESPVFEGKLNAEQKTLAGTATQGGNPVDFKLNRTGDAKVITPSVSSAIGKELEGTWEGTLQAGQPLRLELKLKNDGQGHSTGSLVSLDQGAIDLAITNIVQTGNKLSYDVKMVGGKFSGTVNEGQTELTGEWSQGGQQLPLTMKKKAAAGTK